MSIPAPTDILVRVIAKDGKFLGDDIGGAAITVRDAETREILAQGITSGDSGPNGKAANPPQSAEPGVMCVSLKRGQPLPTGTQANPDTASKFVATLLLSIPKRIEVSAFGPLAARASANTVSVTTWVYPGKHITAENGLLLELPGLICQIVSPAAHTMCTKGTDVNIVANVAMMCGCPISNKKADLICPGKDQPWLPNDFEVFAVSPQIPGQVPLVYEDSAKIAGQFTGTMNPEYACAYKLTVYAQQKSTGNTGVDFSTFIATDTLS